MEGFYVLAANNPGYAVSCLNGGLKAGTVPMFNTFGPGNDNIAWVLDDDGRFVCLDEPGLVLGLNGQNEWGYAVQLSQLDPSDDSQCYTMSSSTITSTAENYADQEQVGVAAAAFENNDTGLQNQPQYLNVLGGPGQVGAGFALWPGGPGDPGGENNFWYVLQPVGMNQVTILQALWGTAGTSSTDGTAVDVTEIVAQLVSGGTTTVAPSATLFPNGPTGATLFTVSYQVGLTKLTAACATDQNESVTIATSVPPVILDAVWGAPHPGGSYNVTSAVQALVQQQGTGWPWSFNVSIAEFGDPANDQTKTFGMSYIDSTGCTRTTTAAEGNQVTIM